MSTTAKNRTGKIFCKKKGAIQNTYADKNAESESSSQALSVGPQFGDSIRCRSNHQQVAWPPIIISSPQPRAACKAPIVKIQYTATTSLLPLCHAAQDGLAGSYRASTAASRDALPSRAPNKNRHNDARPATAKANMPTLAPFLSANGARIRNGTK